MKHSSLRNLLVAAVALVVAPCSVWASTEQLDLICRGQKYEGVNEAGSFVIRYTVDLAASLACELPCVQPSKVLAMPDGTVVLAMEQTAAESLFVKVNRNTGEFGAHHQDLVFKKSTLWEGVCEVAPFTGFPKRSF